MGAGVVWGSHQECRRDTTLQAMCVLICWVKAP